MRNELPEGGILVKEITQIPEFGKYRGKSRPTGWLIYEYQEPGIEKVRIYRYDGKRNVVDYWITPDEIEVMRKQVRGKSPFGVWPELHRFPKGSLKYDAFYAMMKAMDSDIYHASGWWEKQVGFMVNKAPGTERFEKLHSRDKEYAKYMAFTYGR